VLLSAWSYFQDVDDYIARHPDSGLISHLISDGILSKVRMSADVNCNFAPTVSESLNLDLDVIYFCFLQTVLPKEGNFMQVVINREGRMMGQNFDAELRGEGWDKVWVKPTVRTWSYRVDTLDLQDALTYLWLAFAALLLLHGAWAVFLAVRVWRRDWSLHLRWQRGIIFVPTMCFPVLLEFLRAEMALPDWTILVTITEILMLLIFMANLEAIEPLRVIVRIMSKASRGVLTFTLVLVPLWFVMGTLYCQLFGVNRYDGFAQALHDLFSVFVIGKEVEADDYLYGPTQYWLMYYISSLLLVLTLSQVFITILIDAYGESKREEARLLHAWRTPDGYKRTGERFTAWERFVEYASEILLGYSPKLRCWTRLLAHGFQYAMVHAGEAGRVMYSQSEVWDAMVAVGCSEETIRSILEHWAHVPAAKDGSMISDAASLRTQQDADVGDMAQGFFIDDAAQMAELRANTMSLAMEVGCKIPFNELEMLSKPCLQRLHGNLAKLLPGQNQSQHIEQLMEMRSTAFLLARQQGSDLSYAELQTMSKAALEAVIKGLQFGVGPMGSLATNSTKTSAMATRATHHSSLSAKGEAQRVASGQMGPNLTVQSLSPTQMPSSGSLNPGPDGTVAVLV